ncbi:membrane protein insertion efficiency factor YidD [Xylanimonas oleitrophica]|uniref:Putative membrane protein insertion efficiency factor n=1 Tax=Xylanimonas oleitrophica TaxID=2607479 RepID=A0A2W5WP48_9MICO|nr:membrane protein insertion efficiency factor YidD [Xylanimonas oleitrophica]PZR53157.1 membrane protein insertion efficiency factor YidD [Xylanimonas oleitrophica]
MRLETIREIPASVLVGIIRVYQVVVSPMTGPTCKYYPSCSHYAVQALRTHGALRGTGLALWRILRCNPWSLGGVDDVPPARPRTRGADDGASRATAAAQGAGDDVRDHAHQH